MNLKELLLNKIEDAFEELNINADIIDEVEDYLEGTANEEDFLNKLPNIDFNSIQKDKIEKNIAAYSAFKKYKVQDYLRRFINILFKIGKGTASYIISKSQYAIYEASFKELIEIGVEEYIALAIYSDYLAFDSYRLGEFKAIYKICAENPKAIIKASECVNNNAKMMLYSIYCSSKETNRDDIYKEFLKSIEEDFLESIDNLFENKMNEGLIKEIQEFILKNVTDEDMDVIPNELIINVKSYIYSDYLFKFLVGLSAMNVETSEILKRFVRFFTEIDYKLALNSAYTMLPISTHYCKTVINLSSILEIPLKYYISWYAERFGNKDIGTNTDLGSQVLKDKLKEDKGAFKEAIKLSDTATSNYLISFLHDEDDKNYYVKELENNCVNMLRELVLKRNPTTEQITVLENFLYGEIDSKGAENALYNLEIESYSYWNEGKNLINLIKMLSNNFKEKSQMYDRSVVMLAILGKSNYIFDLAIVHDRGSADKYSVEKIKDIFNILDLYKVSVKVEMKLVDSVFSNYDYSRSKKNSAEWVMCKLITEDKEEVVENLKTLSPEGRCKFLEKIFKVNSEENATILINNFSDNSKQVKDKIIEIFSDNKDNIVYFDMILEKLKAKKQGEREVAIKILDNWTNSKTMAITDEIKKVILNSLKEALESEKSQKIKSLLMEAVGIKNEDETEDLSEVSDDELAKSLLKGNKKNSISWIEFSTLPKVRLKEKEEYISEDYLKAILICYSSMGIIGINKDGNKLAEKLNKLDLALFSNEVFDRWLAKGAEAKKRWVLSFSSIYGGEEIVKKLNTKINEWPKFSRGAIASEAVRALALNGSPTALLIVDGISRKFKFKQVKSAAVEALDFAAEQMGIEREELSDKIVPTLGFDIKGERIFDYGQRKFIVRLTENLEIEVYDENEKKLKNLPSPGKRDDEIIATDAYTEFKTFKKQLKTTIGIQTTRLDLALSSERKWIKEAWTDLFVNNAIMHQFAIGLIWGVYENKELKDTFRYMEDGTFNTKDEDEFEIPEDCEIGLVHPLELTDGDIDLWKEQLENYEIKQPVEQLNRRVFVITEEEKNMSYVDRFGGKIINGLSLSGKIMGAGWYRGSVQDAGGYYDFYKEDKALGLGAELSFEGLFVGDENEDTTIYVIRFYKAGTVERGSYVYDEIKKENLLKLNDVPNRFFSETMYQVDKALASSTMTNEEWKNKVKL